MPREEQQEEDRVLSQFVTQLAGRPAAVVIVTAAVALAATAGIALIAPGIGAVGAVSMLATLWALFLALVIYLLTAKDTDKVLDHIAALEEQLSAALENPGEGAAVLMPSEDEGLDATSSDHAGDPSDDVLPARPDAEASSRVGAVAANTAASQTPTSIRSESTADVAPSPAAVEPPEPPERPGAPSPTQAAPTDPPISPPGPPARPPAPFAQYGGSIPSEHLAAWEAFTGLDASDITRLWTPDRHGRGPWVIEGKEGKRWSVFQPTNRPMMVIPLGERGGRQGRREDLRRGPRIDARVDMRRDARRDSAKDRQRGGAERRTSAGDVDSLGPDGRRQSPDAGQRRPRRKDDGAPS